MVRFSQSKFSKIITQETMIKVYNEIKTPYKYGAVIKLNDSYTDSPSVFRVNDKWYMTYVTINMSRPVCGYDTYLAVSDNLIDWKTLGIVLSRKHNEKWDSEQIAGYIALPNIIWGGSNEPEKLNDYYFISYLAGSKVGYETDPLFIGLAYAEDITIPKEYKRLENPILSPLDNDNRWFEGKTLYKSYIFEDKEKLTGFNFVNFYNASNISENAERIGIAVSNDMFNWERYGSEPVIDDITGNPGMVICGDPQIVKWNDIYIMFYFRNFNNNKYKWAHNTFACSYDLINWTKWQGEPILKSEYEWENIYAHKNYVIKHNGVVYHFYCAVNDKNERFIALATSEKIKK